MKSTNEDSTPKTTAQLMFHNKDLIIERPEGMTQEEYKAVRYLQNSIIKKLFRHKPSRRIANLMR
jgi:hypothetical protein